ncbi:MAG: DNA polymerase III, subunit gamma and tau [Armatimonadota bacterium]
MCVAITEGSALDVAEFDAASEAGVGDVRDKIIAVVDYPPMIARMKVFIIDEVHDLSGKAFDALLKTIEEPPAHLVFILATTEAQKVPPTIRSRCQKFEFHRASMQNLRTRLTHVAAAERLTAEPAAINAIARMADGGYRDALTLLEQAMLSEGETITLQGVYDQLGLVSEEAVDALLNAIRAADAADLARRLDEIAAQGRDPRAIVESMLHRLTDLTRAGFGVSEGGDATREASLHETAARFGRENLLALRSELAATHQAIRDISLPRLWLEAELARIALKLSPKTPSDVPPLPTPVEPVVATPRPSNFGRQLPPVAPADEVVSQTAAPPAEPLSPQEVLDATREAMDSRMVMKRKLEGATVDSCDNGILVLRFDLALTAAWFKEDAKRRKFLLGELERHGLNVRAIECVAEARTSQGAEPESVELPLQGSDLHRAIKQVMSAPDDNTTP